MLSPVFDQDPTLFILMTPNPILQLSQICLALPEAVEAAGVGSPSFTVRKKIFAMHHPHHGRPSLWLKAPRGFQDAVVAAEPERYFVPPYVGHHGWVGVWLDIAVDWELITDWIEESYRMTAPKKLIQQLQTRS
ncbi:MAG: MmcQ/YjbR family DNA-binding protein [Anaerolineae bacterium]